MDSSVKKNSYELLSMSSSDSDTPQQVQEINFKSRRKRLRKRLPSVRSRRYEDVHRGKCCHTQGKMISLSFIVIILCCWLLILSWLIVVFNDELKQYNDELKQHDDKVMAIVLSNQGIPESLQKCRVETKEVQTNQSELFTQFTILRAKMTNLTTEMSTFSGELQEMRAKVINIFDSTEGLHNHSFSSVLNRIDELNNSVTLLRASENRLEAEFLEFQHNITSLRANSSLSEKVPNPVDNVSSAMADTNGIIERVNSLYSNITYLNESFSSDIQSLRKSPFLNFTVMESFNDLLNQNISIRLDTVEDKISQLSTAIHNFTENYQVKNLSNSTFKFLNRVGTGTQIKSATAVRSDKP